MGVGLIAKPHPVAAISASGLGALSWLSKFPGDNTNNNDYGRVGRTNRASQGDVAFVTLDLGWQNSVDVIAVLWHNLRATDTVQIQAVANENEFVSGPFLFQATRYAVTGGTRRDYAIPGKMLVVLGAPVSARYWRIILRTEGSNNPNGFMQASRIFVGKAATFAVGAQKATIGAKDMNTSITTEVGETRSQEDPLLIRPVAALGFDYAKQTEMEEVLGAYTLSLGVSRPMLICPDLSSSYLQDSIVFGRPEQVISHESTVYDVWSFEAVVTSIGP